MKVLGKNMWSNTVSVTTLIAAAMLAAPEASAQQLAVGGVECPIVDGVATCSGDLSSGVFSNFATPLVSEINVENVDGPITPDGFAGFFIFRNDTDITLNIEDGVSISTLTNPAAGFPAQGIAVLTENGFDVTVDSGANIVADGNGLAIIGIEVQPLQGGNISIANRGDISAVTTDISSTGIGAFNPVSYTHLTLPTKA